MDTFPRVVRDADAIEDGIYCPYCGQATTSPEDASDFAPCRHVLFTAHTEVGLVHLSPLTISRLEGVGARVQTGTIDSLVEFPDSEDDDEFGTDELVDRMVEVLNDLEGCVLFADEASVLAGGSVMYIAVSVEDGNE